MSSFTEELVVRVLYRTEHKRRCVEIVKPFAYEVGFKGSGDLVEVEPGDVTDFGSEPRLAWLIDPPFGLCAKADAVHDKLYRTGARPRAVCDRIWREAMGVESEALRAAGQAYARPWWILARYAAVRLMGWRNFGARHPRNRPRWRVNWTSAIAWFLAIGFSLGAWGGIAYLADTALAFVAWL